MRSLSADSAMPFTENPFPKGTAGKGSAFADDDVSTTASTTCFSEPGTPRQSEHNTYLETTCENCASASSEDKMIMQESSPQKQRRSLLDRARSSRLSFKSPFSRKKTAEAREA
eukprot:gnl/MRDRNA2_/MRDRNA2_132346_c0_seq1.p2 gnl/MRDRNA2_/MRDRNA2_132346_c0~~gnl/MRDRNA2_/MRDRNA2_132346_c0_seq1.p2  ORF type:complete len:114 (+),score=22.85 gnl/MRDRNA2_/MRDRNA2_132346_c0_seq1:229-570(+)